MKSKSKIKNKLFKTNDPSKLIKLQETSADDLNKIAESIGIDNLNVDWGSSYDPKMHDDIPSIWNIGDFGVGTHWVASYKGEYFDPFGLPPDVQFINHDWQSIQIQDPKKGYCGTYCILWLWYAIRGDEDEFFDKFTDLSQSH